jgi:hypothetical protein
VSAVPSWETMSTVVVGTVGRSTHVEVLKAFGLRWCDWINGVGPLAGMSGWFTLMVDARSVDVARTVPSRCPGDRRGPGKAVDSSTACDWGVGGGRCHDVGACSGRQEYCSSVSAAWPC